MDFGMQHTRPQANKEMNTPGIPVKIEKKAKTASVKTASVKTASEPIADKAKRLSKAGLTTKDVALELGCTKIEASQYIKN